MACQCFPRLTTVFVLALGCALSPLHAAEDAAAIQSITGLKGVLNPTEGTFRVAKPRDDVPVTVGQNRLAPFMGLTSWAAFAGTPEDALVVGDFAVLENELQRVLRTLRSANINIVAIHQHMIGENPRMMFLHYYGRGKALDLAQGVKAALNTQPLAAANP